jgi:GxxExxY protein
MMEREDGVRMRRTEISDDVDSLSRAVIGASIEVHRLLGPGFAESVYEEALCVELSLRSIPFARQAAMKIDYKGHRVGEGRLDLLVGNELILELKAVDILAPVHTAQLLSYLRATDRKLGLLINFNVKLLKQGIVRVVL